MIKSILIAAVLLIYTLPVSAQCVMCKAAAESSLVDGKSGIAIGLNDGIFYLAAFPYIIIFTLIFIYLRRQNKIREAIEQRQAA